MSSVDGDSDQHSLHSRESVDGDFDVPQPAVRAPAPAQVLPKQFSDVGAPAMFFMIASSNGLWKDEFAEMPGLHCDWADNVYNDGQDHLIGIILGRWEFVMAPTDAATEDHRIVIDLCGVHRRWKNGYIVYKALNRLSFSSPVIVQAPFNPHSVMSRFKQTQVSLWHHSAFVQTEHTLSDTIRHWKSECEVDTLPTRNVYMCPKAAVFAVYGIDVFHAVGVSAKVHGTKVIAKDPTAKHIRYLKDQAI